MSGFARASFAGNVDRRGAVRRFDGRLPVALAGIAFLVALVAFVVVTAPRAAAAGPCGNEAIRAQQGSTFLPECRAWELVNPPTVDYGDISRMSPAANDGSHVAYMTPTAGDNALGDTLSSISVAGRTPSGWVSRDANMPSLSALTGTGYVTPNIFNEDFTADLLTTTGIGDSQDGNNAADVYELDLSNHASVWRTPPLTLPATDANVQSRLLGATADLERVIFRGDFEPFAPGGPVHGSAIYSSDGVTPRIESVLPDGSVPALADAAAGAYQWGYGTQRGEGAFVPRGGPHGVSDDGNRIFFSSFNGTPENALYLRDHDATPVRTVAISASQRAADLGTPRQASFLSASHDGNLVYFVSNQPLTESAPVAGGIYRYVVATGNLDLVVPAVSPSGLGVSMSITSDDQSHIYFVAEDVLGAGAEAGKPNVYVWTEADGVRFIGIVNERATIFSPEGLSRVSPDGRYALITSTASLDSAPNNGKQAVYEYDYDRNETVCVSCRTNGEPSQGEANLGDMKEQFIGFPAPTAAAPRNLTLDGKVFFATTDQLVPQDHSAASDIYEYANGEVSLISSGTNDENSFIEDNSDNGSDVFFLTRAPLVGADQDAAELDLYDARIGGGFAEPPPPPAACQGEACRGGLSSAPSPASAVTATVVGDGNAKAAPKCKNGKVKRHGKCVPKKQRHKQKPKQRKRHGHDNRRMGR